MKKTIRALALMLALLSVLCTFASCAASRRVYASPVASKVVAVAGEVEVLYEELYYIAMNRLAEMEEEHGDVLSDPALVAELEGFVWENLLTRETALVAVGYDYGINVHDGNIKEQVGAMFESILETEYENDRAAYIEALGLMHMTDHYARTSFGIQDFLATEIVLAMLQRGELDTTDATALERVQSDEFVRTVHVFISKTNGIYSDEQNRANALALRTAIAAESDADARYDAMRDAIGGKYNNDFGDTVGNGYYFTKGEMDKAYEDAAFSLAEYGVSDVVETDDGYYVIMRLPKNEEYIALHLQQLKEKSYFVVLNEKVEQKLVGMTLEKTEFGEELDFTDLPTLDVEGGSRMILIGGIAGGAVLLAVILIVVVRSFRKRKAAKA